MPEEQPALSLNSVVDGQHGSYRVIDLPEAGAYAQVYRVQETRTGREAILKLNAPGIGAENVVLTQAQMALTAAGLPRRVVDAVDVLLKPIDGRSGHIEGLANGRPCRRCQLSEPEALRIAIEFAEVLQACARKGIAYLDVKPLDHIFWQRDPWQITIIDWNVAKTNASLPELRDDVLKFCERLPELFTGQSQDDPRRALHPLGWSLPDMVDEKGRRLSYATWCLLAKLALCWGNPLLPRLRDLVKVPSAVEQRTRNVEPHARQLVDEAWTSILEELGALLALWSCSTNDQPTDAVPVSLSVNWHPEPETLIQDMAKVSIRLLQNPGNETSLAAWKSCLPLAEKAAEQCVTEFNLASGRLRRQSTNEHEPLLTAARLLRPQDARLALAWSAYAIWDRVGSSQDEVWKKLITDLVGGRSHAVGNTLEISGDALQQDLKALCQAGEPVSREGKSSQLDLAHVWEAAYAGFRTEAMAWTWLVGAERREDPAESLDLLHKVHDLVPEHPLLKLVQDKAEAELQLRDRVVHDRDKLLTALRGSDYQVATQALSDLRVIAAGNPMAARLVRRLEGRVNDLGEQIRLQSQLEKALGSWDKQDIVFPLSRLAAREGMVAGRSTVSLLADQLKRRLQTIDDLEKAVGDVEQRLVKMGSVQNVGDIPEQVQALLNIGETLRNLELQYSGALQIQWTWQHWYGRLADTLRSSQEKGLALLMSLPTGAGTLDSQLSNLNQLLWGLNELGRGMKETYRETPQGKSACYQWQASVAAALQAVPDAIQRILTSDTTMDDTMLDSQKGDLEQMLEALNHLEGLRESLPTLSPTTTQRSRANQQWQHVNEVKASVQTRLQEVESRYQTLAKHFEEQLKTEKGDWAELEGRLSATPPSFQDRYRGLVLKAWRRSIASEVEALLQQNRADQALRLVEKVPERLLIDEEFREDLDKQAKRANDLRLLSEAERLLQHAPDVEWTQEAIDLLKRLEIQESSSPRFDEVRGHLSERVRARVDLYLMDYLRETKEEVDALRLVMAGTTAPGAQEPAKKAELPRINETAAESSGEQPRQPTLGVSGHVETPRQRDKPLPMVKEKADLSLNERLSKLEESGKRPRPIDWALLGLNLVAMVGIVVLALAMLGDRRPDRIPPTLVPAPSPPAATPTRMVPTESTQEGQALPPPSVPVPSHTPAPPVVPTRTPVVSVSPTPSPILTPWPAGSVLKVVNAKSQVYRDNQLKQPLWTYKFKGQDRQGKPVTAEVTTLAPPMAGAVQVQAEFVVYEANLTIVGDTVQGIQPGARSLRSPTQRADEGEFKDIQALLAVTSLVEEIRPDAVYGDRGTDPIHGNWRKVRLIGWIPVDAVQP